MSTERRIGLLSATGIGVGSMLGAGVFSDMWVDVLAAGSWALAAVLAAAAVALMNALSTAQLAARYPVAGGAYAYGRAELGAFAGHVAGAAFVVGKTVSVAAGATVLGAYVLPGHAQGIATAAVVAAWALNARGITRTARGATVIAVVVVVALVAIVALAWAGEPADAGPPVPVLAADAGPAVTFLVAVAACFFAFAGYARIATLGEEVRDPSRTIGRAILLALAVVVALYLAVAAALVRLGADRLTAAVVRDGDAIMTTGEVAPIEQLARVGGVPVWVVTLVASLSVGGAMLAVMAGAGRTAMAMAREGDLPRALAHTGASGAPWRAEGVVALAAVALVWTQGASLVLVSASSVLLYYAVANLAAARQRRAGRTVGLAIPAVVSLLGLACSLVLAAVAIVGAGEASWPVFAIGGAVIGWPAVALVVRRRPRVTF
ncbi:APC family permease [Demequina sp. NBRC 110051]|uniref:APC family permease n=1 Tax=Demequina sp. NBRC 110051 TaxID=1570340 RepID=UPI00190EA6DD|nr:APC family permease [Demequina sp. NBRC 110051]